MRIIFSPDQMRPQRDGMQGARDVSFDHSDLGQRFCMRIVTKPTRCIGHSFVHARLIFAIKRHAWAAGENKCDDETIQGRRQANGRAWRAVSRIGDNVFQNIGTHEIECEDKDGPVPKNKGEYVLRHGMSQCTVVPTGAVLRPSPYEKAGSCRRTHCRPPAYATKVSLI